MDDRKRVSGRLAAIFIVIMLIAVPATATVITQNFMRADVTGAAACFVKIAGADVAATADVDFDNTNTIVGASGVTFLQEAITVTGYAGDRVTYSDVVRYQNTCDYDITVTLRAEADPAGNPDLSAAGWADKYARVYISNTAAPALPVGGGDWSVNYIEVLGGAIANATAGPVVVSSGSEVQGAFLIETDDGSATTGTLRYTAEAVSP